MVNQNLNDHRTQTPVHPFPLCAWYGLPQIHVANRNSDDGLLVVILQVPPCRVVEDSKGALNYW